MDNKNFLQFEYKKKLTFKLINNIDMELYRMYNLRKELVR